VLLESIKAVGRRWVLRPSRLFSFLAIVGALSLVAPTSNASEPCDPTTTCVYVYSTIDERQFAPLFIAIIIIAIVQLTTLILQTTKPFDLLRRRKN
jgi:hypothetical protein